jgi:hypothetical protein
MAAPQACPSICENWKGKGAKGGVWLSRFLQEARNNAKGILSLGQHSLLWDNTAYALGVTATEGKDAATRFLAFQEFHR